MFLQKVLERSLVMIWRMSVTVEKFPFFLRDKVKCHPMRSGFVTWICVCDESTRIRFDRLREFIASKHAAKRFLCRRILFERTFDLSGVHLARVIVNHVSFTVNMDSVFEFPVTHEACCGGWCSGEADVDCQITALDRVKMRCRATHVWRQVESVYRITVWKFFPRYVVANVVIHFSRAGRQGGVRFDVFGIVAVGKL